MKTVESQRDGTFLMELDIILPSLRIEPWTVTFDFYVSFQLANFVLGSNIIYYKVIVF